MINAYCDNLQDLFAQAVHYGILREEDAQCFAVEASISPGFFFLAAAAIILALLNSFTAKAVYQYFRDRDPSKKSFRDVVSDAGLTNADSDEEQDDAVDAGFAARIQPVPVLFTDTFRWLLRADPKFKGSRDVPASSRELFGIGSSIFDDEHWDLPEAQAVSCDSNDMDGGMTLPPGEYRMSESLDKKVQEYSPKQIAARREPSTQRRLNFDDEASVARPSSAKDSVSTTSDDWRSSAASRVPSLFGRSFDDRTNLKDDATYATPPTVGQRKFSSDVARTTDPMANRSTNGSASVAYSIAASVSSNTNSGSNREDSKQLAKVADPLPSKVAAKGQAVIKDPKRSLMGDLMSSIRFKAAAALQNAPPDRNIPSSTSDSAPASVRGVAASVADEHSRTLESILNDNDDQDDESEYYEETVDDTLTSNQEAYDEYTLRTDDMSQATEDVNRRRFV
jgi:hypothetical protein